MYTASGTLDRNHQLQQFAPLVKRLAHHLAAKLPASVQVDDLIQAGLIGLADAINRYEESQGTQFETYATTRIRGAMLDELRANDWLPRSLRKVQRQIEQAVARTEQKLSRTPNEVEIAAELGVSLKDYQSMLGEAHGTQLIYYEDFADDEGEDRFLDRHCADASPLPEDALADAHLRRALVNAIEHLPEREKLLMGLYYEQDLNFREIAAVLGVTESRVCQLHSQAVARLRTKMKDA
jgi:RNA polymerase sigma factor for flagellar operon FliA